MKNIDELINSIKESFLYEADGGMTQEKEVIPQEKIADSGSDVEEINKPDGNNGDENIDYDEKDLEGDSTEEFNQNVDMVSNDALEKEKMKFMFSRFENLLSYCIDCLDMIDHIDENLLDFETFSFIYKYRNNIKELIDKINIYLTDFYLKERYERIVYVYVLFRTELISNIKGIRNILDLNNIENEN